MAFNNPAVPWSEVERVPSGRSRPPGDGSDAPVWSRKPNGYAGIPEDLRGRRSADDGGDRVRAPYAELHCHSNFSFLDGASHPETLVEQAARAELDAIILTDHDGMYGAVRFNEAARELGVRVGYGAELSLGLTAPQAGAADPEGTHLLVIARQFEGHLLGTTDLPATHVGRSSSRGCVRDDGHAEVDWPPGLSGECLIQRDEFPGGFVQAGFQALYFTKPAVELGLLNAVTKIGDDLDQTRSSSRVQALAGEADTGLTEMILERVPVEFDGDLVTQCDDRNFRGHDSRACRGMRVRTWTCPVLAQWSCCTDHGSEAGNLSWTTNQIGT